MNNVGLEAAVIAATWIVVSVLVLWWLGAGRGKHDQPGKLYFPRSTLAAAFAALAGFGLLTYLVNDDFSPPLWLNLALLSGSLLSLLLVAEYAFSRHEVAEQGLRYGSITGRRGELAWSELSEVRYGTLMKWFVLKTESGKVARISAMCKGLPEFARLLLEHAPASAIDPSSAAMLRSTAEGNLPSLWR